MAKRYKMAASIIFDAVDEEIFEIARKKGMKETVHMLEAALIAKAIEAGDGNYSAAARILHTPVTTLGSRKEVLQPLVRKMAKKLRIRS